MFSFQYQTITSKIEKFLAEQRESGHRSDALILNKAERHELYQSGSDKFIKARDLAVSEFPRNVSVEDGAFRGVYWGIPVMAEEELRGKVTLEPGTPVGNYKTGRRCEVVAA